MGNWFEHKRNSGFIEIIVRDFNGSKIESFKVPNGNKIVERRVFGILRNKYDYFKKENKDLDWLKK